MPRRFPLYAKILCWFFLNLFLLAAGFYLVFRAQFHFGLDWLLSDRFETAGQIMSAELRDEPHADWDATLQHFAAGYHNKVHFMAFAGDGTLLAGEPRELPDDVREQIEHHHGGPPGEHGGPPPMPPPPPRRFIHTSNPSLYWVIQHSMTRMAGEERPMPLNLVAVSDTFAAGGLFFDLTPWLGAGVAAVLLSVLLWLPLVRDINRAIAQLTTAANQIAQGRFDARVNERRRDELGSLGRAVNQMAARLNDLVTGQKRFLGDVAHELVSPLAKLRVALGIIDQRALDSQKASVADAEEEAAHMARLVEELLSFSKASLMASNIKLRAVGLREAAESAVLREQTSDTHIALEIPQELKAKADPELLGRALANLLRNAIRYAGEAGPITVFARREGDGVRLMVTDCGPGVPEAELARIFDPFYRVDASRDRATGGTGLGLAIVKNCVEACGGTVSGRNRQPTGLEVTMVLPYA